MIVTLDMIDLLERKRHWQLRIELGLNADGGDKEKGIESFKERRKGEIGEEMKMKDSSSKF